MPKPKPKKPAGTTGHLPWGKADVPFQRLAIPDDARERERFVVEALFKDPHHGGPNLCDLFGIESAPEQNPDDGDFPDFFLPVSGPKNKLLELTEFAPLTKFGAYDAVPHAFQRGGLADAAVAAILAKWDRYRESARGAALLMYTADWRLHLDERTVELVRRGLARKSHGFSVVIYYALLDDIGGSLYLLWPQPNTPEDPNYDENAEWATVGVRGDLTKGP